MNMSVANQKRSGHQPDTINDIHKRGDQKPNTAKIILAITEDHRNDSRSKHKHVYRYNKPTCLESLCCAKKPLN